MCDVLLFIGREPSLLKMRHKREAANNSVGHVLY